jgi:hypothetical protein
MFLLNSLFTFMRLDGWYCSTHLLRMLEAYETPLAEQNVLFWQLQIRLGINFYLQRWTSWASALTVITAAVHHPERSMTAITGKQLFLLRLVLTTQ